MTRSNIAILLAVVTLLVSGCASKKWVRQEMNQERTQTDAKVAGVDQRVGGLDERLGGEAKRVDPETPCTTEVKGSYRYE